MNDTDNKQRFRIAILISGSGSTLKNLIELIDRGELDVEIVAVVSSNPAAGGLRYAGDADIPARILETKNFNSIAAFSDAIFAFCREQRAELIVMGGFLKRISVPADFVNRIINMHPSLIPAFCGKNYYGHKVHQAILDYGCKLTGCTVHFVDDHYDHGPIIMQRPVEVLPEDTAESLAARVQALERQIYPEAIRLIAEKRVMLNGRCVKLLSQE